MSNAHQFLAGTICWGLRLYMFVVTMHAGWSVAKSNMVGHGLFGYMSNFEMMRVINLVFTRADALCYLTLGIAYLFWLAQSCSISRDLGLKGLEYSPNRAVLSYFIPLICIIRPLQVMEELWKASAPETTDPVEWQNTPGTKMTTIWWSLVIATGFANALTIHMLREIDHYSPPFQRVIFQLDAVSDVLTACVCVMLLALVTKITARQKAKVQKATVVVSA